MYQKSKIKNQYNNELVNYTAETYLTFYQLITLYYQKTKTNLMILFLHIYGPS